MNDVEESSLVKCKEGRDDDDEVAEVQRAGGHDGGFQPHASAAAAPPALAEYLRRTLRRP